MHIQIQCDLRQAQAIAIQSRGLAHQIQLNTLFRLQLDQQAIGLHIGTSRAAKNRIRHLAKLDVDFGAARGQALAGAQIKRHARPAPIVHVRTQGNEGFGAAGAAQFFGIAGHHFAFTGAAGVLADHRFGGHVAAINRAQ